MAYTTKRSDKITSSHGTITDVASEVIRMIHKLTHVTKISLGEIRHIRGGRRNIKFLPINGGIKAVVRGNGAIQYIFIYTKHPEDIQDTIQKSFDISP